MGNYASQHFFNYLISCVQPAYDYFTRKFDFDLIPCRLIGITKVKDLPHIPANGMGDMLFLPLPIKAHEVVLKFCHGWMGREEEHQ